MERQRPEGCHAFERLLRGSAGAGVRDGSGASRKGRKKQRQKGLSSSGISGGGRNDLSKRFRGLSSRSKRGTCEGKPAGKEPYQIPVEGA